MHGTEPSHDGQSRLWPPANPRMLLPLSSKSAVTSSNFCLILFSASTMLGRNWLMLQRNSPSSLLHVLLSLVRSEISLSNPSMVISLSLTSFSAAVRFSSDRAKSALQVFKFSWSLRSFSAHSVSWELVVSMVFRRTTIVSFSKTNDPSHCRFFDSQSCETFIWNKKKLKKFYSIRPMRSEYNIPAGKWSIDSWCQRVRFEGW